GDSGLYRCNNAGDSRESLQAGIDRRLPYPDAYPTTYHIPCSLSVDPPPPNPRLLSKPSPCAASITSRPAGVRWGAVQSRQGKSPSSLVTWKTPSSEMGSMILIFLIRSRSAPPASGSVP